MTNRPKTIFKYSCIDEYFLENISKNQLYFNFPRNLNDPYDCLIPTIFEEVSIQDIEEQKERFPELKEFCSGLVKESLETEAKSTLENYHNSFADNSGITCFSERSNNILMWSHYANNHSGACIELSTESELFRVFNKVNYTKLIPKKDLLRFFNSELSIHEVVNHFITKFDAWEYEEEWRLFVEEGGQPISYPADSLKSIYFGLRTEISDIEKVVRLDLNVKLFKAKLSDKEFEIDFEQLN
ncbi:DUF2971 domain-containing protein [Marinicella meishanensis]|uniref:DUF2971 domain-containing protein n=1 Tax=Marinicella meishanensis TaxID=2873263 RepID=UPI001CBBB3C9|nr:DUF2971 domain-containing protein [Marinicella sp. NBU2979]